MTQPFLFQPLDPAVRRDPYALYERGRREFPVFAHEGLPMPLVSIFRYADVQAVLRDTALFSNDFAAGRNVPVRFRSIREVRDEARLVLSLLAHAGAGDTAAAFARGAAVLELGADVRALPRDAIEFAKIGDAFERLLMLAPFVKGRLVEACVEAIVADAAVSVVEAETLRAVAAALDCPVPPLLG